MEQFLMEGATVKVIVPPVDLNDAANTGERVDMQKFKRVTFICVAKAGTTPSSHTFSPKQHTVASSGSPAALSIANPYFHKVDTATYFTKVEPTVAASSFDLDTIVGDTKYVVVFEVLSEDLTDGYRYVSLDQTDSAGAQLGTIIAVCHKADFKPAYTVAV